MRSGALFCFFTLAFITTAMPAHAAEPMSKVDSFEWSLFSKKIVITDKTTYAEGTFDAIVDPKLPSWTIQNGKLVVPSCTSTLAGPLTIKYSAKEGHNTSMLHWTIPGFHTASAPIDKTLDCGIGAKTQGCTSADWTKTWDGIGVPLKPGENLIAIRAWTSKQAEKSMVKSTLLKVTCTEAPPTILPNAAQKVSPIVPPPTINVPPQQLPKEILTALEVRSLRLDFGFPDANAVQWFKGQPASKEILFHEITGPGSEVGGAKWGLVAPVTANGQTVQSRGIDSCRSAVKLKKYFIHAKNNGTVAFGGGGSNDLRASTTGPSGNSTSTGNLGPIAPNVEGIGTIDVANQGVVFFPSGTYLVKGELLGSAAGAKAENNSAQFTLTFKCKSLSSTTWQ